MLNISLVLLTVIIKKTLYHTINIILIEMKLFTIRYKINQVV